MPIARVRQILARGLPRNDHFGDVSLVHIEQLAQLASLLLGTRRGRSDLEHRAGAPPFLHRHRELGMVFAPQVRHVEVPLTRSPHADRHDQGLQLAHVERPVVHTQCLRCIGRERELALRFGRKARSQRQDLVAPLAEQRQANGRLGSSAIEVRTDVPSRTASSRYTEIGGGAARTSTGSSCSAPTGRTARSCSARSSAPALRPDHDHLVRSKAPDRAAANTPLRAWVAPENAFLVCPNSSLAISFARWRTRN